MQQNTSAIKKKENNAISSNMDRLRDYRTKQSKSEKNKYHILFMCGFFKK